MEINKQLFEDVLSGKLKGKFVLRNVHNIHGVELKPNHTFVQKSKDGFYIIRMPNLLFNVVDSNGKSVYCCIKHEGDAENNPNFDVVNFMPDTNMKENKLTIEIPDNKVVDWDESKKQNKIVLKDKQLTYKKICEKLFKDKIYFSDGCGRIAFVEHENTSSNEYITDPNNSSTEHQLECILAKNQLANVCKFLNGDTDYSTIESCWGFELANKMIRITYYRPQEPTYYQPQFVCKSKEIAQQAIEILGEETVKLALEPLGI